MGNMLFEVLNSQTLGASHSYLFQEDLNLAEAFSYYPDTASNATLIQMLEGTSTAASNDLENLEAVHFKLPAFQEEKHQQTICPLRKEGEVLAPKLCKDDIKHSVNGQCRPDSLDKLHDFVRYSPVSDTNQAQHPSTPQNSEPSSTLLSGENYAEAQHEPRLTQSTQVSLDEGSTSTAAHNPVSFARKKFTASMHTPRLGEKSSPKQPRSGVQGAAQERKKRKRARACKNSEEVESQRITHIAVERNRRKQMNEHLTVLRSLMPGSYIQRGDQASIIGGAIEFVKELEQILQSLQLQKQRREFEDGSFISHPGSLLSELILGSHFTLDPLHSNMTYMTGSSQQPEKEAFAESKSSVANVEVKVLGSSVVVKILAEKRPQQLLHILASIDSLHLKVTHLNITTIEETVLYAFNIQIGVQCQLHSASDLAISIQHIFHLVSTDSNKQEEMR